MGLTGFSWLDEYKVMEKGDCEGVGLNKKKDWNYVPNI